MDSFDLILVYVDFVEYGRVIFFLGEVLKQAGSGLLKYILGYWLGFFQGGGGDLITYQADSELPPHGVVCRSLKRRQLIVFLVSDNKISLITKSHKDDTVHWQFDPNWPYYQAVATETMIRDIER